MQRFLIRGGTRVSTSLGTNDLHVSPLSNTRNEVLNKFPVYKRHGRETVSFVPWLIGKPSLYTSNLDVARQVVAGGVKAPWIKPESAGRALLLVNASP